ncbi:MAG: sigma-70 family RNA polymerase sigma factor [Candidatus Eremiobacteraeota bacterium]|nr:sigma-70 family RNA polymerase sigma factor [Candidatus Eremiobacteraeota bacterium]
MLQLYNSNGSDSIISNIPQIIYHALLGARDLLYSCKISVNNFVTKLPLLLSIEKNRETAKDKDDLVFVRQFKNGDMQSFDFLVKKYSRRIYNTILRMVKNDRHAEDLTQDTFLQAFKSLKKFREQSKFYTWIYRIAVNKTLNYIKVSKRSLAVLDQDIHTDRGNIEREIRDAKSDPNSLVQQGELRSVIETAVRGLTEKNRLVFVLKEMDGFTYTEISEMTGISEQTVRTRIHRAKKVLQEVLKPYITER